MVAKSYCNAAHFAESFQKLGDLRESGETCDIRLLTSNKEISAHKLVLASVSEYFKNAIYGMFFNNSGKTELELKEVQYEILAALVNYMYSGTIEINLENVFHIYHAADYYLINFLKEMCLEFLQENIDTDNCVKIWVMANNCKHAKLIIEAGNFIFSNLAIISNSKEFLNLSNEEILDFYKLWPKHELSDSIITSLLNWASHKQNWEDTVMNILKDIPHKSISEDYLENYLSNNKFMQNNIACNCWMMNIYKEKLKLYRLKQENSENKLEEKLQSDAEIKFSTFLLDQPIIFVVRDTGFASNNLYKYNLRDGTLNFFHKISSKFADDYETYKNWVYVVGEHCQRFLFDDLKQKSYESAFRTNHGEFLRTAILNDSMHIFGGNASTLKGSTIDLSTKKFTNFSLSDFRVNAGVAASNGSIYICGGWHTDTIERFDPRESGTSHFGSIASNKNGSFCSAAILSNQLYCAGYEYKMMDLRNNKICVEIESPGNDGYATCLVASYGKLYTDFGQVIHEYDTVFESWKGLGSFPELHNVDKAISFQ